MTTPPDQTALLLLDYQVALCEDGPNNRAPALVEQVSRRAVVSVAAKVLQAARTAGLFVVHVRLAFDPTYKLRTNRHRRFEGYPDARAMLAESPEAQIVDRLAPVEGEPVVTKGCVDPFIGTCLLPVLNAEGIRHVILGGVATNLVVESAARHACDAGLHVTVVEDMCASFSADLHQMSMSHLMPMFATVHSSTDLLGDLS